MKHAAALAAFLAALPAAAMAEETTLILDRGLAATLNLPEGATGAPAVLMLHGFGSSRDEVGGMYAREAAALAEKGIASIRLDFAGFGKSGVSTADNALSAV